MTKRGLQDNIDKGFAAILYGLIAVIVFMIMWYKGFGLIANIGLLVNLTFIVAILSMLQASLLLGIAGIVLTVGMAVDANVLIFERIREEINVVILPQPVSVLDTKSICNNHRCQCHDINCLTCSFHIRYRSN